MTRNGKIARLPRPVREQLNRRLADAEPGKRLVPWLNGLPEVRSVLAAEFGGRDLTEQNLSEWKQGGHRAWLLQQELLAQAGEMKAQADDLRAAVGPLTDHVSLVLAARFAATLARWDGEPDGAVGRELRVLRQFCQDVVELRRGDHSAARLQIEQARLEAEQEETEEEAVAHFQRWAKNPKVRAALCGCEVAPEDRERRMRELFGLAPLPAVTPPPDGNRATNAPPSD